VLGDAGTFCSGQGVGLNEFANAAGLGGLEITVTRGWGHPHPIPASDPSAHDAEGSGTSYGRRLQEITNSLADRLVSLGSFDRRHRSR